MDPEPLTSEGLSRVRRWFQTEARVYPWSETEDPYAIWISEVMLQQTVVTAAVAPFRTWMARWPDLASLAAAREEEVLRAWEGLGYASRARNLHRAARELASQGRATLPDSEALLRALPGIGEYTAAAILSFAFHRPTLTLDANLKRVFQRLDEAPNWSHTLETRWRRLWEALVDATTSRESNQAVMQLGQRVCRAQGPLCGVCPLAPGCRARAAGLCASIPAPKIRTIIEKATTAVLWYRRLDAGHRQWWLAHPTSGRFSNHWLAPDLHPAGGWQDRPGAHPLTPRTHTYTKYRDRVTPWVAPWSDPGDPPLPAGWTGRWVLPAEAGSLGMVSVYRKILDEALKLTLL